LRGENLMRHVICIASRFDSAPLDAEAFCPALALAEVGVHFV
jgi:hypothetical protein